MNPPGQIMEPVDVTRRLLRSILNVRDLTHEDKLAIETMLQNLDDEQAAMPDDPLLAAQRFVEMTDPRLARAHAIVRKYTAQR